MIFFKTKADPAKPASSPQTAAGKPHLGPAPAPAEEPAAVKRKKSDSDGKIRRSRQTAEDNRLL